MFSYILTCINLKSTLINFDYYMIIDQIYSELGEPKILVPKIEQKILIFVESTHDEYTNEYSRVNC